jgi:putative transposase
MQYRRAFVPGGTYFFTVNLLDRKKSLLIDYVEQLKQSIHIVKQRHPFHIDAMVVLPEHLHAIWTLPDNDVDYPKRWRLIKSGFSRTIPKNERIHRSRQNKHERAIWQRRYWEHLIRDELDFKRYVDYIHYNPVKHGYVDGAVEWQYSSIHKFIRDGVIDEHWGVEINHGASMFGE